MEQTVAAHENLLGPPLPCADVAGDFRKAMRRFAATVCVVTASTPEGCVGITMTSVTSVSMDPCTLLICVNRSTRLSSALGVGSLFCVNLLRASQQAEAAAFGGAVSPLERFSVGRWIQDKKPAYLDDAQANIFCSVEGSAAVGTHLVVVGRVQRVRLTGDVAPLVYSDGRYVAIDAGSVGF